MNHFNLFSAYCIEPFLFGVIVPNFKLIFCNLAKNVIVIRRNVFPPFISLVIAELCTVLESLFNFFFKCITFYSFKPSVILSVVIFFCVLLKHDFPPQSLVLIDFYS